MTSSDLYDAPYFLTMRGGGSLYEQFATLACQLEELRRSVVLDVGCGRGYLLKLFADMGVRDIWGVDFSVEAATQARAQLSFVVGEPANERIRHGSIVDAVLFEAGSIDFAFMTDVVEHLPSDVLLAGLRNVALWLKPNGRLVVHTFPTRGPHAIFRFMLRATGKKAALARLDAIHCNVQTRARLPVSLAKAGLIVEKMFLRNDLVHTSSFYRALPAGIAKSTLRLLFNDFLGNQQVCALLQRLGIAEFAAPSIYAICQRPD